MAGALSVNGAQSDKPTKFAAIYTGRQFTGIWTNRSPLRDAASTRIEEKFYGPRGDAMIAGANVEISNKLTLIRRYGNPQFSGTSFTGVQAFGEFRINKALSDVFGTTLEQIDLMTDTTAAVFENGTSIFTKSTGAGQTFFEQVGNELFFSDGVDNKKKLQSLFTRTTASDSTVINTNIYPFMDTFLVDPNGNIQQMIGAWISTISDASITNNVLTLTVSDLGSNQAAGTQFMLWGFTNAATTFLNGATITLNADYTSGGTTLTANFTHANMSQADTGYVQIEKGTNPTTGSAVPTWGTVQPSAANDFMGSVTLDGTVIWVNRGVNSGTSGVGFIENWGIDAPTQALTFSVSGAATGWAKNTYYSPVSIYVDNIHGNLWQITTPGTTGAVQPTWPVATPSTKIDILSVSIDGANNVTFTTETQSLVPTNVVTMQHVAVATFLNGQSLTVASATANSFTAALATPHAAYSLAADSGLAVLPGTTQADGTAVWTCIQSAASLTWAMHKHYHVGDFLLNPVGAAFQFFVLSKNTQPYLNIVSPFTPSTPIAINAYGYTGNLHSSTMVGMGAGNFGNNAVDTPIVFPTAQGIAVDIETPTSLHWFANAGAATQYYDINGAGEVGTAHNLAHDDDWQYAVTATIFIPAPGSYTFTITHKDGAYFGFDTSTGAYRQLGTGTNIYVSPARTAINGYPSNLPTLSLSGTNYNPGNVDLIDSATWTFPAAGNYGLEIDYAHHINYSKMIFTCNGQEIAITPDESGASQPGWPAFTSLGSTWDSTNKVIVFGASVQEAAKQYTWSNVGPSTDFIWKASTPYTLPLTAIVDVNGNEQGAVETGVSGTTAPAFSTSVNGITADTNPPLTWLNEGAVPTTAASTVGTITATSAQGWIYGLALVNTLDNTVSNIGPLSAGTGPVVAGQIVFAPGAGLPTNFSVIDPQADYVAIFRTTDGGVIELLIPSNGNTDYTVPLTQYLQNGYIDTTPDTGLDTLVSAAAAGENTPPLPGAVNLTYHLQRIFFSLGNTVFYTTGPLATVGNGVTGVSPLNFDVFPSQVQRLVPTAIGLLVFLISDIYIIPNNGGTILPAIPYVPGIGLANYNALDTNGPLIGFFSTDRQFLLFSPSAGLDVASMPIADQFSLNNGLPGTSWNTKTVRVAFYANGQDMAWFVADGQFGWYKLINTPAPETGQCWSPFATIQGGVTVVQTVETSPGMHSLLLGPTGTGKVLFRSSTATTDGGTTGSNGTPYPAYAVFGSYVLTNPGQIAQVAFFTTDSIKVGSPLILGVILDEALPYYTGSFEILKHWETDPPGLPESTSILGQRFYLSELDNVSAACRHLQLMVQWPAENAMNELNSFSIWGAFVQEQ